ncbi:MAG TPA: proteasome subunit beta [Acidobacteriota bacterium]
MTLELEQLGSSFVELLRRRHPELLPAVPRAPAAVGASATTIVALRFEGGVVLAADRRATIGGHLVVNDEVVKVFKTDEFSAIAIAGSFGPSVKMARLFQTELEHYEKIEGVALTLEGKANRLSQMIEQNLQAAMMGLPVMPLFAGYDHDREEGRIFEYDITGGTFIREKTEPFSASGSGGDRAHATLEHFWCEGMNREQAVELARRALEFAAKKDAATGGASYLMKVITKAGIEDIEGRTALGSATPHPHPDKT